MILTNFLVGLPVMLVCLAIQAYAAFWCVRHFVRRMRRVKPEDYLQAGIRPLLVAMVAMMLGTFVQVGLWGVLFVVLGEFSELYDAVYHSAVNFASLGYGDIVMSKQWKLLGPLEAINGVLMLGMSAAALMVILQQLVKLQYRDDWQAADDDGSQ
jgi:ion channel